MPDVQAPLLELLSVLVRHRVEFIVVGGVLQGAPIFTADLDILHERTPENIDRLLAALSELQAIARGDPRKLAPNASHLRGPGHLLLMTRLGPLDVLGTIEADTSFEQALADSEEFSLERLIKAKEFAGRPKDKAVLPILKATLEERRSGGSD